MKKICLLLLGIATCILSSCGTGDDNSPEDYTEWKHSNDAFVEQKLQQRGEDGSPYFEKIVPVFAEGTFTLMHWHNDRTLTAGNLLPLDNSTVKVNYELRDMDGTLQEKGADRNFRPNKTVVGFWTALTNMHVGDTVTAIVPYAAGYGDTANGNIKPYTTLVFSIRLKEIVAYEIKP